MKVGMSREKKIQPYFWNKLHVVYINTWKWIHAIERETHTLSKWNTEIEKKKREYKIIECIKNEKKMK